MSSFIVAADLKVAAILAKAHGEDAILNNSLLLHDVVYRFKSVIVHSWTLCTQPEYTISILAKEVLCLSLHTAKCVFKHFGRVRPEMKRVFGKIALI